MAQTPAQLQPYKSPRHYLGAELRAWRRLRGLSLAQLGRAVHSSGDMLGKIEKAQRWPTEDLIRRCDGVLDTAGMLTRLYDLVQALTLTSRGRAQRSLAGRAIEPLKSDPDQDTPGMPRVVNLASYRRRKLTSAS